VALTGGVSANASPAAVTGVLALPAASSPAASIACPSNAFCLYPDASWGGSRAFGVYSPPYANRIQLSAHDFNDIDSSWINNRSGAVRVYSDWKNGAVSGAYFTAPAHSSSAHVPAGFNDMGSGLALY
jgi:hypothetical protein